MTQQNDELSTVRKLVVVFDICSSTALLEDLMQTGNLPVWRDLLIGMKEYLLELGEPLGVELYKFVGDGWILLFPLTVTKDQLRVFLGDIAMWFEMHFDMHVRNVLQIQPETIGLTFGVDSGDLVRMVMNDTVEYVGRAINVAARLQGETKSLKDGPSYHVLMSNHSYNSLPPRRLMGTEDLSHVKLRLRNLNNGAEAVFITFRVL